LSDRDFEQPSNEDAQGNVISMRRMDIDGEDDIRQTPNKEETKAAAEEEEEQEQASPSTERQNRRSKKHIEETEKMKKPFAVFTADTKKQLNEQAERHASEIAAMKKNKHGNTRPFNNQNYANTTSKRSQSICTFHCNDQILLTSSLMDSPKTGPS
jgi:hypothetical protein